jgi:hypothetical protein
MVAVLMDERLENNEEVESVIAAQLDESGLEYFVIGTAFIQPGESESSRGRLLLYTRKAGDGDVLVRKGETEVGGCVYAMATLPKSRLAAAVNSKVTLSFSVM